MAKLEMRNTLFTESVSPSGKVPVINKVLSGNDGEEESLLKFTDVPMSDITPRPINNFSQSGIEALAKSIRDCGNRPIFPIVIARPLDLPQDSEVIRAFTERGVDYTDLKYVIVDGERRFHAFQLLQKEEAIKLKGTLKSYNCFDKIPANILTKEEARNERQIHIDANMQARHLGTYETFLHVMDALGEIDTEEKKKAALKEMGMVQKGKKFDESAYITYYIETVLGIENTPKRRIDDCHRVYNNGTEHLRKVLLNKQIDLTSAGVLSTLEPQEQENLLLVLSDEGKDVFRDKLKEIKEKQKRPKQRITNKDARKEVSDLLKALERHRDKLYEISEELGKTDRYNTKIVLKETDALIRKLKETVQTLK